MKEAPKQHKEQMTFNPMVDIGRCSGDSLPLLDHSGMSKVRFSGKQSSWSRQAHGNPIRMEQKAQAASLAAWTPAHASGSLGEGGTGRRGGGSHSVARFGEAR